MIFCVEDDSNIRELVVYTLNTTGLDAKGYEDAKTFMHALEQELPELVLLDVMLPGEDGLSVLRRLKASARTKELPVIMVTAKGAEFDVVRGLDAGADDYITKPFGMMELISRVKAVLRRTQKVTKGNIIEVDDLKMDLEKHEVTAGQTQIVLTYKEFELLRFFMQNRDIVLSRERLLEKIWGYDFQGESRTLDVHIRSLRHKLGESGERIQTVRGVGYRLGDGHEK